MSPAPGRVLAAALLILLPACAGPGFDLKDLPAARVAIIYRTVDETHQVEDQLKERRTRFAMHRRDVDLHELANALGLPGGQLSAAIPAILGHLALLDPRTGAVKLAPFAERGAVPEAWSPDHRRLLFRSDRMGTAQIFEWDSRSGDVHPVTSLGWDSVGASYGPHGEIAVVRKRGLRRHGQLQQIYLLAPGQEPRRVTDGPRDLHPRISPDGRLLIFNTVDPQGQRAIASVDLVGGGPRRLLARGGDACFTPDGKWLFYSHKTTRNVWKIWQMRPDGSAKHPFGDSPYYEYKPAVSPDGRYLLYIALSKPGEANSLVMVRSLADGRDRALVIDGTALDPVW